MLRTPVAFVSYRCHSPPYQFSLTGAILVYLSQWILPWSVRLTRRVGTLDFCPASAPLVSPVQNISSSPHTFRLY